VISIIDSFFLSVAGEHTFRLQVRLRRPSHQPAFFGAPNTSYFTTSLLAPANVIHASWRPFRAPSNDESWVADEFHAV